MTHFLMVTLPLIIPFPLIISLLLGSISILFLSEDEKKVILDLYNYLKGTRFIILGERASGKTVLHKFLTEERMPIGSYNQTIEEKTKNHTIKLKGLKLKIRESVDIGGSEDFRQRWKDLIQRGDCICYLINSKKIYNGESGYLDKVSNHIHFITNNLRDDKILYVINSHCDKIPDYDKKFDQIKEKLSNELIKVNKRNTYMIFGSLKNTEEAEKVVYELLNRVKDDRKKKIARVLDDRKKK